MDETLDAAPASGSRYLERTILGEGGMGQVQLVDDAVLGRAVARKVMHAEVAARPEGVKRFLREARIQGRLEHPAVVPVYDLGLDGNGVPWFTMKQVRGLTLQAVLEGVARGEREFLARFPRRRLLTAFVQVCRAIDYAHSRSVLHRDLKPGNIMLGEFGDVHVLDWGLAGLAHAATEPEVFPEPTARKGSVFGTPGYMAPEQVLRKPLDERTDVYALGAILFEVLALTPMFAGTVEERLARTVGEEVRGPAARAPELDVPPELDVVVVAATRRDVNQRTASARALADAVEQYLDGDRDLELRRALAARHLDTARPLVEALDVASTEQRETAMDHVNSALALDPGNAVGLVLLRRLLTHTPTTMPPEVQERQRQAEEKAWAGVARTVALRTAMWLALVPLAWSMGPLSVPLAASVVAVIVGSFSLAFWAGRRPQLSARGISVVLAVSALPLIGASLIFGSFVLVPALASTGMVLAASFLRPGARGGVIVFGVLVVLVPFLLGELGVVEPSYRFIDDALHITPQLLHFPPWPSKVLLVLATITTLAVPSLLAGQLRDRLALAEKQLLLTAWHLERLGKQLTRPHLGVPAPRATLSQPPPPTAADSAS